MSEGTSGNSAQKQPPAEGFWAKQGVYVGIGGIFAAILIAIFSLWQAAEISKVSEVAGDVKSIGGDVRATNTRIDQIFPLITQQANDIGSIKGDLRAATDKITAAAARSEELSSRLTGIVDKQDAQVASVQEIKGSVTKLVDAVTEQRGELTKIEDKIGTPTRPFPQKKTELLDDSYVFSSAAVAKALADYLGAKGVATVNFDNPETFTAFAKLAAEKPGTFKDMFLVTKDAAAARALQQLIGGK